MKKYFALFLLLIPFGVKGQDTIIKSQFPPMGYWAGDTSAKPIFFGEPDRNPNDFISFDNSEGTIDIKNIPIQKHLSLEEKLLMYAQECWEDSTIEVYHVADDFPCTVFPESPKDCLNARHYNNKKYTHREPTFIGFLEYLKKK